MKNAIRDIAEITIGILWVLIMVGVMLWLADIAYAMLQILIG